MPDPRRTGDVLVDMLWAQDWKGWPEAPALAASFRQYLAEQGYVIVNAEMLAAALLATDPENGTLSEAGQLAYADSVIAALSKP